MKFNIHLSKKNWLKQYNNKRYNASLIGTIWEEKLFLKDLEMEPNAEYFSQRIKDFSGFFSFIYQKESELFAAVDIIRSHPLFYTEVESEIYLSDEADWIREQINDMEMDPITKEEFLLTGYVTGKDTLFPNVKQLQAGESLLIKEDKLSIDRYYLFTHREPERYDEEKLTKEFLRVSRESIKQLIDYAQGRQIVIPLSGGYDSRFIVSLLKEREYGNILCFTYGIKGNKEAKISKQVADALDFKWYYVEYTEAKWKEVWATEDRISYQKYASNLNSLPVYQDWLAVKVLKDKGLIENNAVFAPGHTGDMISGGHIPNELFNNLAQTYCKKDVVQELVTRHYSLTPFKEIDNPKEVFQCRIGQALIKDSVVNAVNFADECELWNWQNRQAKFIVNSVRVYEFFDYDWLTPMWNKEFVDFFKNLPLKCRNHKWYKERVNEHFQNWNQKNDISRASKTNNFVAFFSKYLKRLHVIGSFAKRLYHIISSKDIIASRGRYPRNEYIKLIDKGYKPNGIAANYYIQSYNKSFGIQK